jgi:Uma2 family endonuclease
MNEITDNIDLFPTIEMVETGSFRPTFSFEEYLEMEKTAIEKHEFHNGQLHTMAGATKIHNHISGRIITALNNCLDEREEDYAVCTSDMKVRITAKNKAVYPDVTVIQGEAVYYLDNERVVMNPILLVEVLSDSTEDYDRGLKFDFYKTLPSFREYVLVSQNEPKVEVFFLQNTEENVWEKTTYEGLDAVVGLRSIGCPIKMKQIYHRVFKAEVGK